MFLPFRLNNKVVALKEIRLQQEEGAPFTAIREGILIMTNFSDINHELFIHIYYMTTCFMI